MLYKTLLALILFTLYPRVYANTELIDYQYFKIWLNCDTKMTEKFEYTTSKDSGSLRRSNKYQLDPEISEECQQLSSRTYGFGFDRGHLVPANHLDHSREALDRANYMTNILPQKSEMNRGAWLRTEEIIECYRDLSDLKIIGGPIWNDPFENTDLFSESHGVKVPSAFWKIVYELNQPNPKVIAWIVPNTKEAAVKNLDLYLVTPRTIESATEENFDIPEVLKDIKETISWPLPKNCDRS